MGRVFHMALDYILMSPGILTDKRSLALAGLLDKPRAYQHVLMLRLWMARGAPTGEVSGRGAVAVIEQAAGWEGENGAFVRAAVSAGWLMQREDPKLGTVYADADWAEIAATQRGKSTRGEE